MRVVVQRSLKSRVSVDNKIVGEINKGLVLLVGFTHGDLVKDIDFMIKKICNLRIFEDENNIMNKSLLDIKGEILSISQFTLYADTKNGNRPSYKEAMDKNEALNLYNVFNEKLSKLNVNVQTGIFGSEMEVSITNDGPVTIILESR